MALTVEMGVMALGRGSHGAEQDKALLSGEHGVSHCGLLHDSGPVALATAVKVTWLCARDSASASQQLPLAAVKTAPLQRGQTESRVTEALWGLLLLSAGSAVL